MLTDLAQRMKEALTPGFKDATRSDALHPRQSTTIKALPLALTLTLVLTVPCAQSAFAETLESSNPFLPPGYGEKKPEPPKPVVQTNGPISREIEFRGVVKFNGKYQFSVFNKTEQKGYWIQENQAEDGISVRGYDADSRTLTVNMNGRSERLTLMSVSEAPLPVVASTTQPNKNATPPTLPPTTNNISNRSNNSSDDNRRRVIPRRRVILPKK
ncbi:hypothetical protein SH580_14605 [Coraliomargarita algicola]|uniref:Uncharacterized protein n=1 Tax=Coraliomargarita algicola TaxID=3092156 RepID=A0ABZ0RGH5_9BACT|nr:hypothetical protein [Coraliomargarita sp. J2-16]WPJ94662.1 hypothetical protein SH580_14605 [Coraliomargarita sp. J2-16]